MALINTVRRSDSFSLWGRIFTGSQTSHEHTSPFSGSIFTAMQQHFFFLSHSCHITRRYTEERGAIYKTLNEKVSRFPLHIGWNLHDLFVLTNTDLSCLSFSLWEHNHWAGWKPSSVCTRWLFQINMSSVFPKAQRCPVVPNMERWQLNTTLQGNTRAGAGGCVCPVVTTVTHLW